MKTRAISILCVLFLAACSSPDGSTTPSNAPPTTRVTDGKADSLGTYSGDEASSTLSGPIDRDLDSREFKVMLEPSLFSGDSAPQMLEFLQDEILRRFPMQAEDTELDELRRERTVQYLDTPGSCELRASGYTLRDRREDDEREVTLKFRSPERYLASAGDVEASDDDADTKFEEDIKPGYASVFSRSTDVPLDFDDRVTALGDAAELYPVLDDLDTATDTLEPVGGLTIHERTYGRLKYDLGEFKAKMDVTLWYIDPDAEPVVAELSFKYEEDEDDFDVPSVQNGLRLFQVIQGLQQWRAEKSRTKTSFAYEYDPSFCQ